VPLCGLVAGMVMTIVGIAVGQEKSQNAEEQKKVETVEKAGEGLPRKLSDEVKGLIEEEVQRRVKEALDAAKVPAAPSQEKPQGQPVTPAQLQELNDKVNQVIEDQKKVRPSEFNPAIGLVGETIFSYETRGTNQTGNARPGGFDVFLRSVELNVAASVDPFFRGYAVINGSADAATGETLWGIEEAALVSTSLPWNLTLQAGRFFAEFGRLGYIHDHELPFVNRPLPLDQYIGGESRTDGLQLNWLVPVDHYISVTAGVGDGMGSPPNNPGAKRGLNELNFWGRTSTYFDLTDDWQLETGVSGLTNPRTEDRGGSLLEPNGIATLTERKRQLVGVDLKVSYVPLQNNQFSGLTWVSELLYSHNRYRVDPNGIPFDGDEFERSNGAYGLYSYVTYKWDRQWSAVFLYERMEDAQDHRDVTAAYSPYITWATSHWNQIRLQFTHTYREPISGNKSDNAVYIQWAWIIGAHSHGWQQR
jgi:hypothetical protein